MAEHSELVSEMPILEKLSTQERLKLARKRRSQQLKKWSQREKEFNNKRKKSDPNVIQIKQTNNDYKVHFVPSVMLLEAAARNDVEEVRRLLMLGVSPDSTNEDGLTALHQCCIDDSEEMMKLLIDFGANVNAKDSECWTPLHAAATCGHLHLVKYLISKCADLLAVNADGNMPYDICEDELTLDYIESEMAKRGITQEMIDETRARTEGEMLEELRMILKKGEDLEMRDNQGATALHIASANGYISVVEFLLDNHVSTDACDNDQWQAIHAAACWGHSDVLELLVQNGADVNAKTKNGETPFDICEDPELKERIIHLKNELETKKASHPNRLKRSHSQNTRSHSVRRTSIREKSQMARREAREEARIRHEKEPQDNEDDDYDAKQQMDAKELDKSQSSTSLLVPPSYTNNFLHTNNSINSNNINNNNNSVDINSIEFVIESRKKPFESEGEVPTTTTTPNSASILQNSNQSQSHASNKEAIVIRNTGYTDQDNKFTSNISSPDGPIQTSTRTSGGESVKVEIHVTVNTAPTLNTTGTLADLKKQRAEKHRNSLTLSSSSDSTVRVTDSARNSVSNLPTNFNNSSHSITTKYLYDTTPQTHPNTHTQPQPYPQPHIPHTTHSNSPPSPSTAIKKFRGDPSDIVGETQKKGCCIIQ